MMPCDTSTVSLGRPLPGAVSYRLRGLVAAVTMGIAGLAVAACSSGSGDRKSVV
jgi:hypothetical protein